MRLCWIIIMNYAILNYQIECIRLNKAIECATNRSIYDNGCKFENIKNDISYLINSLLNDDYFNSCGVKLEDVDKLLVNKNNSNSIVKLVLIITTNFIIFFALFNFYSL